MHSIAGRKAHLVGCGWFWAWALVGVGYGFGISVIGIFTIPAATIAVVFMARRRPIRGAFGVATGVGSVLLYVAYIQRSGESYDPIHWFVPGIVFFAAGLLGHVLTDES